jgi:hypothetical protein
LELTYRYCHGRERYCYGLESRCSVPYRVKRFSLLHNVQTCSCVLAASVQRVPGPFSPGVKLPGSGADLFSTTNSCEMDTNILPNFEITQVKSQRYLLYYDSLYASLPTDFGVCAGAHSVSAPREEAWVQWNTNESECSRKYPNDVVRTYKLKLNSVALVREPTTPTEQPPLVGEVSTNLCG